MVPLGDPTAGMSDARSQIGLVNQKITVRLIQLTICSFVIGPRETAVNLIAVILT